MDTSDFDPEEDALLGSLDYEEPDLKRQKVNEDLMFDEDDDLLYSVADQLEKTNEHSFLDEDDELLCRVAEHVENTSHEFEFKTGIGRPHPLFLPEVIDTMLSYVNDGRCLSACRLVCTFWHDPATAKWMKCSKVKSLLHVTHRNPFGLAYNSVTKRYETSSNSPTITNLNIADACVMYKNPGIECYMKSLAHNLQHLTFNGNFWCMDQINFLYNILFNWGVNLEELHLIGVTNHLVMTFSSRCRVESRKIKLKILKVTAQGTRLEHPHFNNIHKIITLKDFRSNVFIRDGGMLGMIIHQAESLQSLILTTDWVNPTHILVNGVCSNIRILEVTHGRITSSDLDRIKGVCLKTLKIGPIKFLKKSFKSLLKHLSNNLEELEMFADGDDWFTDVHSVRFPDMPKLKSLVMHINTINLGSMNFIYKMKNLKHLELIAGNGTTPRLFASVLATPHELESIVLKGNCCFAYVNIWEWFPNLKSIQTVLMGEEGLADGMEGYSKLKHLENLSIIHTCWDKCILLEIFKTYLPKLEGLRNLNLSFSGPNILSFTLFDFNTFISASPWIRTLKLTNYVVYEDEAQNLARLLTDKLNSVVFQDCTIRFNCLSKKNRNTRVIRVDNEMLCKFNSNIMIQKFFHAFLV